MVEAEPLYRELAPIVGGGSSAVDLVAELESIIADTKLPATLSQAAVSEDDLPMLAEDAMLQQRLLVNNPREVQLADALEIYRAAY
jgi:alcohol dehydrogenase